MGFSAMATAAAIDSAQQAVNAPASGAGMFGPLLVASALITLPLWREKLAIYSEVAAEIAPIVGLAVAVVTLWKALRGAADRAEGDGKPNAAKAAGGIAAAAQAVARRGSALGMAAVAALAVSAAFLWATRARAEPALPPKTLSVPAAKRRGKRTADDAGEDGTVDDVDDNGAPAWFATAKDQIGLKEWKGTRHNPAVLALFRDAGFPGIRDDETAWCAAFVNAHLERNGRRGSESLAARSFEKWGKSCEPRLGCVVVLSRGDPKSWQGHVGFYAGEDATHVHVLGGNQGDAVSIGRFPKSRVLDYRWPTPAITAKEAAAIGGGVAGGIAGGAAAMQPNPGDAPAMPTQPPPVMETLEAIKGPLAEIGTFWRPAAVAAAVMGCACAAFAIYKALKR